MNTSDLFEVVHEDEDLLVVNKPAGLVCHPTKGDVLSSLISRLRLYREGAAAFLVNRLDRETSGVTLVAKSSEVAGSLGRMFEQRAVSKVYLAIVHGHPAEDELRIEAALGRDLSSPVAIKDKVCDDGAASVTACTVLRRFVSGQLPLSLLRIDPQTGRKHQIRIHLQHAGFPIVGDKIYGGDPERYLRFVKDEQTDEDLRVLITRNQALHAQSLRFTWRGSPQVFEAEPSPEFSALLEGSSGAVEPGTIFS